MDMARPGVGTERITEVIRELEAQGKEPTVTVVRERLGQGSFSTIGAVLADWRRERASESRPAVPEPPESVRHLVTQLWAEAWTGALKTHEPERQAFQRERQDAERTKGEMLAEIARLEGEVSRVESEREAAKDAATKVREDLEREQVGRARAESTAETLQAELAELRAESRKTLETVTAWVERATRAETKLEELAGNN
jgi:chromosome segregation ATPase